MTVDCSWKRWFPKRGAIEQVAGYGLFIKDTDPTAPDSARSTAMPTGNPIKSSSKKDKKSKSGSNHDPTALISTAHVVETSDPASSSKLKKNSAHKQTSSKPTKLPQAQHEKSDSERQKGKKEGPGPAGPEPQSRLGPRKSMQQTKSTSSVKALKKAAAPRKASPAPETSDEENEKVPDGDEGSEHDEEEDMHLHGFSTDDDDSSDEENFMEAELDISKLPTIAKDDATVQQKLEKAKRHPTEDRGVLYLGRLPHGFYEDQLKAYFSQFGTVTRSRLSRNKKTGRSKHYAFIEFDSSSVTQIVAETMDNYLLMGHILRCKVIPKDQVHPELWVGANRKWRAVPQDRLARVQHNKPRTEEEQIRAAKRLLKRQNERKRKLAEAGIKYDVEAVSYKKSRGTKS